MVGDGFGATVGSGVGVAVGVGVGDRVGFIEGLIATPLFQISLLPCFTQVYFIFEADLVVPALMHLVPAMDAEWAGDNGDINESAIAVANTFFAEALRIE